MSLTMSLTCGRVHCRSVYPRIDPAVIMLVTCGDYVLLGSNTRWAPGRYSALAGFLQLGESLESAVCREVLEESGLHVRHPVTPW